MQGQFIILRNKTNLEYAHKELDKVVLSEDKPYAMQIAEYKEENPNSWPMKKTWRMWMNETAEFMKGKGVTMPLYHKADGTPVGKRPFNAQDAHELFVRQWLGVDSKGERYKTASGDKGQMLFLMEKHVAWCVEKGLSLTIPRDSEYFQCKAAQES